MHSNGSGQAADTQTAAAASGSAGDGLVPGTRERIIRAAGKLFYNEGIRAVSLDTVAAEAGVTKRTLYYHFRSKDDLIAACLDRRDQPNLRAFQRWFAETPGDAADKVAGIFTRLGQTARRPGWKGCGFLRTAAELINLPGHPALHIGRAHKKRVEEWLQTVFMQAGAGEGAQALARQVILLLDGAFGVALLHRDASYMETAGAAATSLIRARLKGQAGSTPHGAHPDLQPHA